MTDDQNTTDQNIDDAAQDAAETPDTTPAAQTPPEPTPAPHSDASTQDTGGQDASAQDGGGQDDGGDTFPRAVVEKLRKENAALRDRANRAEQSTTALQRQHADHRIKAAGLKPAAVWAVTELADVLDDHGAIDSAKLSAAMSAAKETLGLDNGRRRPNLNGGDPKSGAAVGQGRRTGWTDSFAPRHKRSDW